MVISGAARAAARILAKAKIKLPVKRKVKRVYKNVLPSPPVKRKLVKDILRESGEGDLAYEIPSASSGGWKGVNVGLLRGGVLRSTDPSEQIPDSTVASMKKFDVKRYEAQLIQQKKAGTSQYPTGIRYGLGEDYMDWGSLGKTGMPYQMKVTDETTLPVMGFFGKTKGFKTKKTLSGKQYREALDHERSMDDSLDAHITGGGDGGASFFERSSDKEAYAIYNKQGVPTRYDYMYWSTGDKKGLKDIQEYVHAGTVSYTKWKKAPAIHPQVARIEKMEKAKRMVKMSGKEGRARGQLKYYDADDNPYEGLAKGRKWSFIKHSDQWEGPDDGFPPFAVGYPTPQSLAKMGVKGPAYKPPIAPAWGWGETEFRHRLVSATSRGVTKRQVTLMKKDIAAEELRVSTERSTRWANERVALAKAKKTRRVNEATLFGIGGGVTIGGVGLYGQSKKAKKKKKGSRR